MVPVQFLNGIALTRVVAGTIIKQEFLASTREVIIYFVYRPFHFRLVFFFVSNKKKLFRKKESIKLYFNKFLVNDADVVKLILINKQM